MAKGKTKVKLLGREGMIMSQTGADYDFIYDTSLIKHPEYYPGDVIRLPDGREFVYSKSVGNNALYAAHGCSFSDTGYTSYAAFATSHAAGVREITIPAGTHAALTEDELRGGYVILFDGASDYATTTRQIIGNAAAVADAAFVVQLDAKITNAIVSGTEACEVYKNPFSAIEVASSNTYPKAGVPATYVAADAYYFWVQTKGISWIAPHSGVGDSQGQKGCFWRHDGALDKADTALATTVPAGSSSQYAGFCVAGSESGNGPLFMLMS